MRRVDQVGLSDLAVAIATKLRMLITCAERIRKDRIELDGELLANKNEVYQRAAQGYAYYFKEKDFPYTFLVDIEMFIFLTR